MDIKDDSLACSLARATAVNIQRYYSNKMIELRGRNDPEEKLQIAKDAMENSCLEFDKYSKVSEYGKMRYQDMRRHKNEPHVKIVKSGSSVHEEMSHNCKKIIASFGDHMAHKLSKGGLAYHIHNEMAEHLGVCLEEKQKTDL